MFFDRHTPRGPWRLSQNTCASLLFKNFCKSGTLNFFRLGSPRKGEGSHREIKFSVTLLKSITICYLFSRVLL